MPSDTIFDLDASVLGDHPLLAHIPVWAPESEEFKSLRESLRTDGQLYEVLIDDQRRVVDGRNRRNALGALRRNVRCREVPAAEVSTIIFRTLMQRRHLTKIALAFLAVPLVEPLIVEAQARNQLLLQTGGKSRSAACGSAPSIKQIALDIGVSEELVEPLIVEAQARNQLLLQTGGKSRSAACGSAPSIKQIALDIGVSEDTLARARVLHAALMKADETVRVGIISRILSGEYDSIGYASTALSNHSRGEADLSKRSQHGVQFTNYLPKLSIHWSKATPDQKDHIREKLRSEMTQWPLELIEETEAAARAARKFAEQSKEAGQ